MVGHCCKVYLFCFGICKPESRPKKNVTFLCIEEEEGSNEKPEGDFGYG